MKHKKKLIKSAKVRVTGIIPYCHGKVPRSRKLVSLYVPIITRTFSTFEQNIKFSTTRKLTCLDHIYTRHLNTQQAGVVPIYYSYHDMTITKI
jgi:hypothetical protein